jgi:acetyl-CoA carboxylase biotin carboxylase subunit
VRLDSGIYAGWNVPLDYDPMLAKLIVWADTREHAIERALRALGEYHVGGIQSNIPLFRAILNDPQFRAGHLHTGYLDQLLRQGIDFHPPASANLAAVAALAASRQIRVTESPVPASDGSRWVSTGRADLLR